LKGTLAHALKTSLTDQDQECLRAFLVNLPEDTSEAEMLPEEAPGQE
jgi:hypothetical protein